MRIKTITAVAIAGLMSAAPVWAQTATTDAAPTETAPEVQTAPAMDTTAPVVEDAAPLAVTPAAEGELIVEVPEGYILTEITTVTTEELKGVDVYHSADEKVGKIGDIEIGADNSVAHVIVDVGGFLGMGEHRVALTPEQVQIYKNADNVLRAHVALTKDELKALPEFTPAG